MRDTTAPGSSTNVSASLDTNYSEDDGLAKFDFQLNDKNTLNAKYFIGGHRGSVVNSQTISQPYWRPDDQAYTQFTGMQWNFTRQKFSGGQHVPVRLQQFLPAFPDGGLPGREWRTGLRHQFNQ